MSALKEFNVIAVDVGTASVRLAIISFSGNSFKNVNVLASSIKDCSYKQDGVKFEQDADEIWDAICQSCRHCIEMANVPVESIKGIAFSATCSLVVESNDTNKIIMWMDHRAIEEAHEISNSCSPSLKQFGGVCSPEMSVAKLIWLKKHQPLEFSSATGFYELPDWLVCHCLGLDSNQSPRSLCCLVCKWGYDAENRCHCDLIEELGDEIYNKVGKLVQEPGTRAGFLCYPAAKELGLISGPNYNSQIAVGTSLIDAHSGLLAMLSVPIEVLGVDQDIQSSYCSLAGTSSCHMLLSPEPYFTRGIWGPYKDAVIKDYYLQEAGQSLTGKLIEMVIEFHEEGKQRLSKGEKIYSIISDLNKQVIKMDFECRLHVLPTYHGNRSPLANPRLYGGIYGLDSQGPSSLLQHYVAAVEALAYEMKLIIEKSGKQFKVLLVSGGLIKNPFFMQSLADILQCRVISMCLESIDFMVMGSALIARHSVLHNEKPLRKSDLGEFLYPQLLTKLYQPNVYRIKYHNKRYACYKEFVDFSMRVDKILNP